VPDDCSRFDFLLLDSKFIEKSSSLSAADLAAADLERRRFVPRSRDAFRASSTRAIRNRTRKASQKAHNTRNEYIITIAKGVRGSGGD
jgi:hypothetical protein